MSENFTNLGMDLDMQVDKVHRSPNKINLKRSSPKQFNKSFKKSKIKREFLKATRKIKLKTYKEPP